MFVTVWQLLVCQSGAPSDVGSGLSLGSTENMRMLIERNNWWTKLRRLFWQDVMLLLRSGPSRFCPPQMLQESIIIGHYYFLLYPSQFFIHKPIYNSTLWRWKSLSNSILFTASVFQRSKSISQILFSNSFSLWWDVTPCSLLKVNRRFGGKCRLHLQGRIQEHYVSFEVLTAMSTKSMLFVGSAYYSTLKTEAVPSSEMWVNFYRTTQRHISENNILNSHHLENLKSLSRNTFHPQGKTKYQPQVKLQVGITCPVRDKSYFVAQYFTFITKLDTCAIPNLVLYALHRWLHFESVF
jgi:hypothetical protein